VSQNADPRAGATNHIVAAPGFWRQLAEGLRSASRSRNPKLGPLSRGSEGTRFATSTLIGAASWSSSRVSTALKKVVSELYRPARSHALLLSASPVAPVALGLGFQGVDSSRGRTCSS
jgi:hypothetical protein